MPSMKAGSYYEGELWLRCPFCGDSPQHPHKAHFSVNNSGVYHCFRCGKSGKFPMSELLRLYNDAHVMDVVLNEEYDISPRRFQEVFDQLIPGPANGRDSALDRYKLGKKDIFLSRRPGGELVGLAIVDGKNRRVIGHRAFGYPGDYLYSSPKDPIRLVEGPYDCICSRDVCVFGSISAKHVRALKGHVVILCPDGDIWGSPPKRTSFLRALKPMYMTFGAAIAGVEILPLDKDPAQVSLSQRCMYSVDTVLGKFE